MSTTQKKRAKSAIAEIMGYTYPKLQTGKEWYIIFKAFDPAQGTMRRKRIKLNHIKKVTERRRYAAALMGKLVTQLEKGWNPWIEVENSKAYHTVKDVFSHYRRHIEKLFTDDVYREDTYLSYVSYLRNIEQWNDEKKNPITYIYQFDQDFVSDFLEHIYIDRDNSAQTRDNYLGFISTFGTFLLEKRYLKVKPTDGISALGKKSRKKKRQYIPDEDVLRIKSYLERKNKYYLLASYVLHYCFIRPKEMSKIRIQDISIKNKTIFISEDNSKNRTGAVVSLPVKVLHLMLDLNIFSSPGSYYLFSDKFMPGINYRSEKQFRDFWAHYVRKDLKLPNTYKFYSLKDTGITSLLRQKIPTIDVRDQARHSSILMTDIYTPHDIQQANELIVRHEGIF